MKKQKIEELRKYLTPGNIDLSRLKNEEVEFLIAHNYKPEFEFQVLQVDSQEEVDTLNKILSKAGRSESAKIQILHFVDLQI